MLYPEIHITIQRSERYSIVVHGTLIKRLGGIYYRPNNIAHPLRDGFVSVNIDGWTQEYYHLTIDGVYHAVATEQAIASFIF